MENTKIEHKDFIVCAGEVEPSIYSYYPINEDGTLKAARYFKNRLFTKEKIGLVFKCTIKSNSISYLKSSEYHSYFKDTDLVKEWRTRDKLIKLEKASAKNFTENTKIFTDNIKMRIFYKRLTEQQKTLFIAQLITFLGR